MTIVACGSHPVQAALRTATELRREGIAVTVLNLHTIKPLDTAALLVTKTTSSLVVTIEEHWAHGGLGSAVAECLAESAPTTVVRVAVPDAFITTAGDHQYLLEKAGIGHERILDAVARWRECCLAREPYHGLDGDPLAVGR